MATPPPPPPPPPAAAPPVMNRTVGVEITGTAAAPNFEFSGGNGPHTIQFNNNNRPGVMVYFKINDRTGTGLLFEPDPRNALSVNPGLANPPVGSQWPGFVPLSVGNEQRKLIVYCLNEQPPTQFKFTLHFVGPAGTKDWDPIGDGQNGPRGGF